jgi:ankyrin repeat protein
MNLQSPETYFDGSALEIARAVRQGNAAAIKGRATSVDLNQIHKQDMTLLFYALLSKEYRSVTELVKAGANPQQIDPELGSPLDFAVRLEESNALAAILDAGTSPNATNSWGTPLLFTAACQDTTNNLQLLAQRKANLDAKDSGLGRTAVFEAFSKLCYDQVEYLIEQGATVDITLVNGVTFAYSLESRLKRQKPGSVAYDKLLEIKRLTEVRGIRFPAEPPPVVKARLKSQGKKVAE